MTGKGVPVATVQYLPNFTAAKYLPLANPNLREKTSQPIHGKRNLVNSQSWMLEKMSLNTE
jgi:hypothetical protein